MSAKVLCHTIMMLCSCAGIASSDAEQPASVHALLEDSRREVEDKIRDSARKPMQVLEFLKVEPGSKVLELYSGGGYYTVILSAALGDEGVVFAQNSPGALRFEEDRGEITAGEALTQKVSALELTNVIRIDERLRNIHFEPNSLDMVVIFQVFHDYFNRDTARADQMLSKVKSWLKPGGRVGVIDHNGLTELDNLRLHRIPKASVIQAFTDNGFSLVDESDILRNKTDTLRRPVFDPMLSRNTDRFLLLFESPPK